MKNWIGNNKSPLACNCASNHSEQEREQHDFYATDPRTVEMLLELEEFNGPIWEPACGNGHMSKVSSSRLQCARNGDFGKYKNGVGMAVAYAWFIWEKGFKGEPIVRWFN